MNMPTIEIYPNEGDAPCQIALLKRDTGNVEVWEYPAGIVRGAYYASAPYYALESFPIDGEAPHVREFDARDDALVTLIEIACGTISFP